MLVLRYSTQNKLTLRWLFKRCPNRELKTLRYENKNLQRQNECSCSGSDGLSWDDGLGVRTRWSSDARLNKGLYPGEI